MDLALRPGEVVGLVGENGSGKSTVMKILVGELAADAGSVTRSSRLGYCPQQPILYERLTCDEHIELFARAYRMTRAAERRSRRELYAALGFERYAGTRADRLSGSTLAKLNLTLALLADPEVLLLDEPSAGFDWDTYLKFWELVARPARGGPDGPDHQPFRHRQPSLRPYRRVARGAGGAAMTATVAVPERRRALALFVRCFMADYFCNPANLIVLVIVPAVFVLVAAGTITQAMELLGRVLGPAAKVETATAGWAAGFLSSIAMYFQIRSARATDRRLVLAGLSPTRLVAARAATGFALAVLVSTVSLLALTARTGIDAPARVIAAILMFAVIYLAIGAVIGVLVPNPVNGAVVILFVWIIDVFIGQVGETAERITRWFPTHFVARWMVDLPTHHGGRIGDLGAALVWVLAATVIAGAVLVSSSRVSATTARAAGQLRTGLRLGLVDLRRNPVLAVLLVAVPIVFVLLAKVTTPARSMMLTLCENAEPVTPSFWFPDVHAGTMTPMAITALSTLAGLFIVVDSARGDRRLRLAGYRPSALLAALLGVIAVAATVVTAAALAITATVFDAAQWPGYAAANLLLAATRSEPKVCRSASATSRQTWRVSSSRFASRHGSAVGRMSSRLRMSGPPNGIGSLTPVGSGCVCGTSR
ncbi:ABC transporter ATP-binding protein/permease [Nocardia sp. NBC_00403]|uniref:ABC transporter ATP-binding protein/permease n=1 Tax=Nocardia sp. NBC_00403 TaxID=2975990 RepID=UPI002E24969A